MKQIIPIGYFFLLTSLPAFAAQDTTNRKWLERHAEGWHWYEPEEIAPEQSPEEPALPVSPTPAAPPVDNTLFPNKGPAPLSQAWLRENLPKYLDAAIDNPSHENVLAYYRLQKIAIDKSSAFSDASTLAITGTSELDQNNRRPLSTFATHLMDDQATENRQKLISTISQRAGIFYYVDNSEFSKRMHQIVTSVAERFNFHLTIIAKETLVGEHQVSEYLPDHGHADLMGVTTFPTVALVTPEGHYDLSAQNAIDSESLVERLIFSALRLNIITKSEFNSIRKFNYRDYDLPPIQTSVNNDLPIDPTSINKMLTGKLQ